MNKWDKRFLELAELVSTWSKDPSTKVGAVLTRGKHVVSLGFNGFPPSIPDKEEWLNNRELKYERVVHAEMNAILNSAQPVKGCTLYLYPLFSCKECAKLIIAAGVNEVIALVDPKQSYSVIYRDTKIAETLFKQGGVSYETYIPRNRGGVSLIASSSSTILR